MKVISVVKALDDKDKQIMKMIIRRVSYEKMSHVVFLSKAGIKHRIKQMKDYYECESLQDLIIHLQENGIV